MSVKIDPNIKKQRIFIDKHGNKVTEEQMFGMGHVMGTNRGTNPGEQKEEQSS